MDRYALRDRTDALDPETQYEEIVRILYWQEFPWDVNQALGLALFRTYAVPTIGRLLADTGEFTGQVQKRYDDTGLILDAVLEHGLGDPRGRAGVRRMNQMHGSYDISNDDMLYVLCTFVVCPIRWLEEHGWRPLTANEKRASVNYYRELGRHMGIKQIPETLWEFVLHLQAYEREHFAYDEGGRAVADSTLSLMTTFPPNHLLPRRAVLWFSRTLMDEPLLDAFGYRRPSRAARAVTRTAMGVRAAVERRMRPRTEPVRVRDLPQVRSYPDGYDVDRLGTFPRTCPVTGAEAPVHA
ncbi:oxygenase MpaB family protein [Solicola sp. PLA-1-18]|uniref:oxygenase MpaB family protein n=1 Tax=Solicola sp. PLA-1-18 TaxID=3380532 RepID=UPI003B7C6441